MRNPVLDENEPSVETVSTFVAIYERYCRNSVASISVTPLRVATDATDSETALESTDF